VVDVGLLSTGGLVADGLLGLLLGTDEQNVVTVGYGLGHEVEGLTEQLGRLGQVDDVDAVALREDEWLHLGVPAASLVAEVDTCLKQLAHGNLGHGAWTSCTVLPPRASWSADRRP